MRVKDSEKMSLKFYIKKIKIKTKIMAPSPITSWQMEGRKVGIVTDFIFLDSNITVGGD